MEENAEYQRSFFEPLILKIVGAVDVMKSLSQLERHYVLVRLMEDKQIAFPDLSKMYVDLLQKEMDGKQGEVATLSLWLGLLLNDRSPDNQHMRRYLWEKGYHRGSAYGDRLDQEFRPGH